MATVHGSNEDRLDESGCREAATVLAGNLVCTAGQHPSCSGANGEVLQPPLSEATGPEAREYGNGQHEEYGIKEAIQEAGPQELGTG